MEFGDYVASDGADLLRFAYLLCRDRGRAEDLVQEALMQLHRHGTTGIDNLPAYVRRIVVTQYLGWRRRMWTREVVADVALLEPVARQRSTSTSPGSTHALPIDDVILAISQLSNRQRAVVVLRYYQDMPDDEIAALLQCSAATVRSIAARSLAKIQQSLSAVTAVREAT